MKSNRRDFLKMTGVVGAGLTGAGMLPGCTSKPGETNTNLSHIREQASKQHTQTFNMKGYAAPALDIVRVGITGVGNRGSGTVRRLASIQGVEIKAINDVREEQVNAAIESVSATQNPEGYYRDENDWMRMCERDDIDLIAICTPWSLHAEQAIYAMEHGKHVYCELPAAYTVDDCWQLVETSERTKQQYMQMSGSCHGGVSAAILNMARNNVLGEIIHGEGGYIHDLTDSHLFRKEVYYSMWRLHENIGRHGNLYPQHALVPMMQLMDINYGDRFDYLVSMQTNDFNHNRRAKELAEEDDFWQQFVDQDFRGNMNNTLIRTIQGRSILIQHDVSTPRPGIRFNLIQGSKGTYHARPDRIGFDYGGWVSQEEYDQLIEEYTPEITKRFQELMERARTERVGHSYGFVNPTDWRLIDCLHNGIPTEMDVYDAAVSSVVIPLSEWSVANRSSAIDVPDFTNGAWERNHRGMNVNLETGGGTTLLV
ncbi:MAG: Gfo/Idh/MocA family oxidoreductase [Balneolales bacterium]